MTGPDPSKIVWIYAMRAYGRGSRAHRRFGALAQLRGFARGFARSEGQLDQLAGREELYVFADGFEDLDARRQAIGDRRSGFAS